MRKTILASLLLAQGLTGCNGADQPADSHGAPPQQQQERRGGGFDKSYDTQLTAMRDAVVPLFRQLTFADPETGRTMAYNLYLPDDFDPRRRYPLVLFMADASTVGKGVLSPLQQGYGGIIWATPESQAKFPCLVLVPSFDGPEPAVNDESQTTAEVATAFDLLNHVISHYNVDRQRVYTTGQSMGGMISFYFNANHADLFAASMFVGSQWDINVLAPLGKQHFLYVVSAGDQKASAGMAQVGQMLKAEGITYGETHFSAKLPRGQQDAAAQALLEQGKAINFIQFDASTVTPPNSAGPGGEHMYSFDYAYQLTPARDWLLQQRRTDGVAAIYNQGLDAQDPQQAFSYFMTAAKQGDALSAYQVGRAYALGDGVVKDSAQAAEWYQKAAAAHIDRAAQDLALMYFNGDGVNQDYAKAATLFREASDAGNMKAPRYLGIIAEEGLGTAVDYAKAQQDYQLAIDRGDITAAARMGWLYERGFGVSQSDSEALKWYRVAAPSPEEAGRNIHPRVLALSRLGEFYEQGRAVVQDVEQAKVWYELAAKDQDATAIAALKRLAP